MSHTQYDTIITEGATVKMVYRSVESGITERIVTVDCVWECAHGMAFVAFCQKRGTRRTFNMANVLFAMPADDAPLMTFGPQTRPPGVPVPTTDLRALLSVTGMDAWNQDRAMQHAATA